MAIMKWGTPPSGDANERRAHVVGHGENVALQHEAFGSKVQGGSQVNAINENYDIATRWSTAPYRGDEEIEFGHKVSPNPHGYRDASRMGKCTANGDTCNANATHKSDLQWCYGHAKSMAKQTEQET
jgi:hypothetical protein